MWRERSWKKAADKSEKERIKRCPFCVYCVIRFVYIRLLVASQWMLFIDLHTKFRWQEHASHLPLCEFTCSFRLCAHTHTHTYRWERNIWQLSCRDAIQSMCVWYGVVCAMAAPSRNEYRSKTYKNLSTLCQTNQSKMCSRRK